jgi:hypothetical protein
MLRLTTWRLLNTVYGQTCLVQICACPLRSLATRCRNVDVFGNDVLADLREHIVSHLIIFCILLRLTSGLLHTSVPTIGSYFLDATPSKFSNRISSIIMDDLSGSAPGPR